MTVQPAATLVLKLKPVRKRTSEAAYSFVMTFANGDDLDWEFAFVRTGHPIGKSGRILMPTKRKKRVQDLPVLHPDAAGIDVGANEVFVAVPARTVIRNLCVVSQPSRETFTP
jgi:hypothetical protein